MSRDACVCRRGLPSLVVGSALALLLLAGSPIVAQEAPAKVAAKRLPVAVPDASDVAALVAFHKSLAALEAGTRNEVAILQIGDSHTAADHVSGRLRSLFQQRFGNAGRGFLPAGAPHAWYRPYQVAVTQTAGWKTLTSNKSAPDPAIYGLSGVVARASEPADVISIEIKADMRLKAVDIGLSMRPAGGSLDVLADGATLATLATSGEDGLQTVRLAVPPATRRIQLRPFGDGPVEITDHTLVGAARGVSLSNVGFIGAQVSIMSRWNWPRTAAQIAALDPSLIVLAFGTNEGHAPVANIESRYAAQLDHWLGALQAAAPGASIVVIGPPDAGRYPKYCLPKPAREIPPVVSPPVVSPPVVSPNATPAGPDDPSQLLAPSLETQQGAAKAPKPPPPEPPEGTPCLPLSPDERANYDRLLSAEDRTLCRWHTPGAFPVVRRIQREVTARRGALFFDWFELFESECGADRWYRMGLAHKDRVHFKQEGYWRAADRLYARLVAGYARPAIPSGTSSRPGGPPPLRSHPSGR